MLKKEKKYLEIIDFIDSLTDEQKLHNKIIQAKEDVINLYTNFCIKESEKILKSKGLDEAINYLNNVNDIIRNNNKILNQINKFENLKPIPLSSLEPFYLEESQYDTPYYKKDSNRDNEGNIRKDILGGTWKGTYVIDKKYKYIDGILFYRYEYKNMSKDMLYETTATLSIYDDKKLLDTFQVSPGEHPITFKVNVSNVKNLVIDFTGSSYTLSGSIEFSELSNVQLHKY